MDEAVKIKFDTYPPDIFIVLEQIRALILLVAAEDGISDVEEGLKWGEPSYSSKYGSTVRFDWKAKDPERYEIYFNCKTSLIETFKEVYGNTFTYEGNRGIVFNKTEPIALTELKHCISLSLRYHQIKHLPLLGL